MRKKATKRAKTETEAPQTASAAMIECAAMLVRIPAVQVPEDEREKGYRDDVIAVAMRLRKYADMFRRDLALPTREELALAMLATTAEPARVVGYSSPGSKASWERRAAEVLRIIAAGRKAGR